MVSNMVRQSRAAQRHAACQDLAKVVELNATILRASLPEDTRGKLSKVDEPLAGALRNILAVLERYKDIPS